ncbi:flagellin N-terminal helical domain-containing protein [Hydrogenobaculum acidophilum]
MAGAIPDLSLYNFYKSQDNVVLNNLQDTIEEASTGYKLLNISENPGDTQQVINLKKEIVLLSTYSQNAFSASNALTTTTSILGNLYDYLQTVNTNVVAAANEAAYNSTQLINMGQSIYSVLELTLSKANEKFGNDYLFGGSSLSIQPFSPSFSYQASTTDYYTQISNSYQVPTYLNGQNVFGLNIQTTSTSYNSYTQSFSGAGELIIHYGTNVYQINYNNTPYEWDWNAGLSSTNSNLGISGTISLSMVTASSTNIYNISYSSTDTLATLLNKISTSTGGNFKASILHNIDNTYGIEISPSTNNLSATYSLVDSNSLYTLDQTPSNLLELSNYINNVFSGTLQAFIRQNSNSTFSLEIAGKDVAKPLNIVDLNQYVSSSFKQESVFSVLKQAADRLSLGLPTIDNELGANMVISSQSFNSLTAPIGVNGTLEIRISSSTIPIDYTANMSLIDVANLINLSSSGAAYADFVKNQNGTYSLEISSMLASQSLTATDIVNGAFSQFNTSQIPNGSYIFNVQRAIDQISYANAQVGSYIQNIQTQNNILTNTTTVATNELANYQDANVANVLTDYSQYQLAYQSLMDLIANQKNLTILKYI